MAGCLLLVLLVAVFAAVLLLLLQVVLWVVHVLFIAGGGPRLMLWVVIVVLLVSGLQHLRLPLVGGLVEVLLLVLLMRLRSRHNRCRHGLVRIWVRSQTHASASASTAAMHPRRAASRSPLPRPSPGAALPHAPLISIPMPTAVGQMLAVLLLARRGRCKPGLVRIRVRRQIHAVAPSSASASPSTAAMHPRRRPAASRHPYCLPRVSPGAALPHALLVPISMPTAKGKMLGVLLLARRGRCRPGLVRIRVRRQTHAAAPAPTSVSTAATHPSRRATPRSPLPRRRPRSPRRSTSTTLPNALLSPTPTPIRHVDS